MSVPVLVTGDDFHVLIELTENDLAYAIDPAAVVKACVVALDHKSAWCSAVTQSAAATGADWPAGRVAVALDATATGTIVKYGLAQIEVQVHQGGGKASWFAGVRVVKGQIA